MIYIEKCKIENIPVIIWGEKSEKIIIAIHGNHSSKIDDCIYVLAREAITYGYQVISFDLPKHGERIFETKPCMVQDCVKELTLIMNFAKKRARHISIFGCSMGAYFSLLAYKNEALDHAWFLSPVVDMKKVINSIMKQIGVNEKQLQEQKTIDNPIEPLYWEYYCYVKEHPIQLWSTPTSILRGEHDTLCAYEDVLHFTKRFNCTLEEQKHGEHWFHTPEQLDYFRNWMQKQLHDQKSKEF